MNFKKRIDNIKEFKQIIGHEPHYGIPVLVH